MESEVAEVTLRHHAETLTIGTPGRSTHEITDRVQQIVGRADVAAGQCTVFVHHTSASVIICENADPQVRDDLERFASRIAPDGDPIFGHTAEGPDDMPAHVRSVLTATSLTIPVAAGRADLGTWQGVYLWEHRHAPHSRRVTVTVMGQGDA
ncbi:MAG: secondary thiamine-phosphate synthase enzyme YjbQ [Myxococcota bacterium]